MELTRKQVIELLEKHHMWTGEPQEVVDVRLENAALDYAINSLKTDETYQIMYEGREIFTKTDMVAILEELDLQIDDLSYKHRPFTWDDTGEKGMMDIKPSINDVRSLIQERINALKRESGVENE